MMGFVETHHQLRASWHKHKNVMRVIDAQRRGGGNYDEAIIQKLYSIQNLNYQQLSCPLPQALKHFVEGHDKLMAYLMVSLFKFQTEAAFSTTCGLRLTISGPLRQGAQQARTHGFNRVGSPYFERLGPYHSSYLTNGLNPFLFMWTDIVPTSGRFS
ncbi:unnamed protein product [Dovyalis caffra]|uniref:Uncharacterized protein n=1 Tax=Dovyalis caffra TaxID=77055 RepID=A0AAV1SX60_9ROSI|nr:unnamed protein product [Dovyalis caffra]